MAGGNSTPLLVRFYDPEVKARDPNGRTLDDILGWSDARLESCHDYIQTIFPLPEGSMFNYGAIIITREVLEAFRARADLRIRLRASFLRMLRFYGFELQEESEQTVNKEETTAPEASQKQATETGEHFTPATASATKNPQTQAKVKSLIPAARIVRGPNWAQNSRNWVVPIDHNHLRITRILRSLRVLGLQDECEAFFEALHEVVNDPNSRLGKRSMGYWRRALELPLHVAPDGTEVAWLGKWVREQEKTIGTK
ncbi:hypothetical protein K491DRAFT_594714 [Lophiostoma macrostomum CBS 122681]|uniref:Opioid growth factor receptor (OGFr) conserved domain-containing protein n=1 Tax=Lophiostoma macrostomum CBS 122681 TaxID=1314788 RepID=A0A6A6TE70_9PLEO|nr:hypothetical protein K491DRAFT_594714 [Lophiostoma macrostomum CBS 122681]